MTSSEAVPIQRSSQRVAVERKHIFDSLGRHALVWLAGLSQATVLGWLVDLIGLSSATLLALLGCSLAICRVKS